MNPHIHVTIIGERSHKYLLKEVALLSVSECILHWMHVQGLASGCLNPSGLTDDLLLLSSGGVSLTGSVAQRHAVW